MLKRATLAVLAMGLVAAIVPTTPANAAADTRTIDATVMPETPCSSNGTWSFTIAGTGADSGIETPDHITAAISGGGSLPIGLTTAPKNADPLARYEIVTDAQLTGQAHAVIDDAWPDLPNGFALSSGACRPTQLSVQMASLYVVGQTFLVTARLTTDHTVGIPNHGVTITRHAESATGKGEVTGPYGTGADGGVLHEVIATDLGVNEFTAEFAGRSVFDGALLPSSSYALVVVVEATPPAHPAGTLTRVEGLTPYWMGLAGEGFDPATPVAIVAYSQPVPVAFLTTDADGAFSVALELPTSWTGQHTVVAVGTVTDGDTGVTTVRYLTLDVKLPSLADTGPSLITVILMGAALVTIGSIVFLAARRRRAPSGMNPS